jgi:hypothetical protein
MSNRTHECPVSDCHTILVIDEDGDVDGGCECDRCGQVVCEDCFDGYADNCHGCCEEQDRERGMTYEEYSEQVFDLQRGR